MSAYRSSFLEDNKLTQIITPTAGAAAQTTINSTSVDMSGFEEVSLVCTFGAITAGAATSVKAQQSADNSTFNDLAGTSQTVADTDDGDTFVIDLIRPTDRYVRLVVLRATQDSVVANALAIQSRPRDAAVTQAATINSETHKSPAEGTA